MDIETIIYVVQVHLNDLSIPLMMYSIIIKEVHDVVDACGQQHRCCALRSIIYFFEEQHECSIYLKVDVRVVHHFQALLDVH